MLIVVDQNFLFIYFSLISVIKYHFLKKKKNSSVPCQIAGIRLVVCNQFNDKLLWSEIQSKVWSDLYWTPNFLRIAKTCADLFFWFSRRQPSRQWTPTLAGEVIKNFFPPPVTARQNQPTLYSLKVKPSYQIILVCPSSGFFMHLITPSITLRTGFVDK